MHVLVDITPEQIAQIERQIAATTDTLREPITIEQWVAKTVANALAGFRTDSEVTPSGY